MPLSIAMVSAPPDFKSERWAGPQIAIVPPSTRSMRAWPDFTRMSLPLRNIVLTWPRMTSTFMGPCSAMASPSIVPMASPAGLSGVSVLRATSLGARLPVASLVFAAVVLESLVFTTFVLGPFRFALSAATESIRATLTGPTPSKLAARRIARARRAIFFFGSRDLFSNGKRFRFLQFTPIIRADGYAVFKTGKSRSCSAALAILYAEPHAAISRSHAAESGDGRRSFTGQGCEVRSRIGCGRSGERSLRHAAAATEMVAPHTDSDNCRRGVQRNSHAGTDAALRSPGLAACRTDLCVAQALHLCVLAPGDHSDFVVGAGPRHRSDEHDGVRRAVDAQSH